MQSSDEDSTNSPSVENPSGSTSTSAPSAANNSTPMPSLRVSAAPSPQKVRPGKPTHNGHTRSPVSRPTTPRVPDGYISESESESYVAHAIGWMAAFAVVGMIFTAYQLDTNPDGICASFCRLMVSLSSCLLKVLCLPCRFICGCPSGGDDRVSSPDYRSDYYSRRGNAGSFQMT